MELFVKSDPVFIVSKEFIAENYEQDIIQEVEVLPSVIYGDTGKRKGIQCVVLFQQHSKRGKFFELKTEVKLYFDLDLLDVSLLQKLLRRVQQYSIDEFFEQVEIDKKKFILLAQDIDLKKIQALFIMLRLEP